MSTPVRNGPQAPENNPTPTPQYFQPGWFPISAITLGAATTVTVNPNFGLNLNYVVGQQVRFAIPFVFGIQQINGQTGLVLSIPGTNQVTVNINSSFYDPFIPSPPYAPTPAQLLAIGDVNTGIINSTRVIANPLLPGSFENISPGIFTLPSN